MAGTAQLVKVCRFAQTVAGCDVTDPNNPSPIFLHIVTNSEGEPISPTSTAFPVGTSSWVGDGSGFIRSYFTDTSFAVLSAASVSFSPDCSKPVVQGQLMTKKLAGGQLLLTYFDEQPGTDPTAVLSGGELTITFTSTQTPVTGRFIGTGTDTSAGELLITTIGGRWVTSEINATDADGYWPRVYLDDRNVLTPSEPFDQVADDRDDSYTAQNERITTAGTVTKRISGLGGDFGLTIIF